MAAMAGSDTAGADARALVEAARAHVGAPPGRAQVGRDPVNLAMVHHWCQALGETNPAYLDEEVAGKTRHDGLISPPGMLGTWTMTMDVVSRDVGGPRDQVLRRLEQAGYTSVVATDYRHTYHRDLRLGDRLSERLSIEEMSAPKHTGLGEGIFVTVRHDYLDQDGEIVGVGRMKLLKFKPRVAAEGAGGGGGGMDRMRQRPRPPVNRDTRFFWDGVAAGELRIQRCASCGTLRHPARPMCGHCRSTDWDWVVASGRGTVHSVAVHHHPPLPGIRPPHAVVLVDLDEGVRFLSHITGMDDRDVRIGMPVELVFAQVPGGQTLPLFRPAADAVLPDRPRHVEAFEDVHAGDLLPTLRVRMTPTFIIGSALATRDFEEVHHDAALARERGSEDLFPNILTSNGLCLRLVTDWAGPEARVEAADIRLGVPAYAGELLELTGEVTRVVDRDGDEGQVHVGVRGTVSTGEHVRGTVIITLPTRSTDPVRAEQVSRGVWAGEPHAGHVLHGRVAWEALQDAADEEGA